MSPLLAITDPATSPHPALLAPFALLLLAIAVMPLVNHAWWERHYPKVALGLASITAAYYGWGLGAPARLGHVLHEYASFIALIGSLFVVSGGIHIRVRGGSTPGMNVLFLAIGAILANVIGTTGSSMLLIRPWLRMNASRIAPFHIVFFIFVVSNIGGCLTPIGDPPLFLGYLKGVPFWWVLQTCWPAWGIGVAMLLAMFHVLDRRSFRSHRPSAATGDGASGSVAAGEGWGVDGVGNVGFLALILGAIFLRSPAGLGEGLMLAAALGSYLLTPRGVHLANNFNLHPVKEVAWLFLGIFITMIPALDYLELHAKGLGLSSPMGFFWLTGGLSALLDNAPTYLTFLAAAMGLHGLSLGDPAQVRELVATHDHEVVAISIAAVFFGAMTYIGNGPNFMVKSIAEHARVKVPGFFDYIWRYALPAMLPVLLLLALLFFSRWRVF
ncbi:MAG TPA: sodium:proton antiporter [Verrucomicrobiales bacterium]|nr:sodium:proton antiporter [Verrucomicrobiales bacterium]